MATADDSALDDFCADDQVARQLFDAVRVAVEAAGPVEWRVTKSQIACRARRPFAWLWRPGRWLRGDVAPLVLSVGLPRHDASPRWKQVVEPTPGRWMHHLELRTVGEIDAQVAAWLTEARISAV